jgi:hypothetical protein
LPIAVIVHWNGVDVPEELKALKKGRYVLVPIDEPPDLPEGTELDLVIDDAGDQLDEAERAALDAAITQAWASVQAGEGRLAADILADLAKR